MSVFLIADIKVTDDRWIPDYAANVHEIVSKHGGKYLVRGGSFEILEGDWVPHRLVLLEFPTIEAAKGFYDSEDYRPLRDIRLNATNSNMVMVEGA